MQNAWKMKKLLYVFNFNLHKIYHQFINIILSTWKFTYQKPDSEIDKRFFTASW